jgi:hypothetical protein
VFLCLFFIEATQEKDTEILRLKDELARVLAASNSVLLPPSSQNAQLLVPLLNPLATHAFLTHAWGDLSDNYENHRYVGKIYTELTKRYNMKLWFDQEYIQGNIFDEIISGLSNTKCIIVFLTKQYESKINDEKEGKMCKLEFDRGLGRFGHDRLIPVIMEKEMLNPCNWSEKVAAVFGSTKYIDFTGLSTMNDEQLNEKCEELFQLVIKRTK